MQSILAHKWPSFVLFEQWLQEADKRRKIKDFLLLADYNVYQKGGDCSCCVIVLFVMHINALACCSEMLSRGEAQN